MSLGTALGLESVIAQHEPAPAEPDVLIITITPDLSGLTKERA